MSNPALALTTMLEDPMEVSKQLERTWESFVVNGNLGDKVLRPVVRNSWERCSKYGISPRLLQAQKVLSEQELYQVRMQSEMVEVALPFMEVLGQIISGTNHVAVLCDARGRIVEMVGDAEVQYRAAMINFAVGTDWSEEKAGTNAIGTAIKHQGPIQVFSAEHYCQGWHPWTCSAAPIRDPINKEILGVLDLTGYRTSYQPHTLGIVVAQVSAIERQLHQNDLVRQQKLTNKYLDLSIKRTVDGVLAVDLRGRVTHINEQAAGQLGIDPIQVLGRTLEDFPGLRNAVLQTIQYGEPNRERESQVVESKLQRELQFIGKPVNEEGKLIGALVVLPTISPATGKISGTGNAGSSTGNTKMYAGNTGNNTGNARIYAGNTGINAKGYTARYDFSALLGTNERFVRSVEIAKRAALTDATVLVQGDSGTGKELIAQAIHLASERAPGPFVALNCGALPKELVGSELFGYADGAFTGASKGGKPGKFELANGGTIFLDEIGEMPLEQQVNLLRVLQEKEVVRIGGRQTVPIDVRVIAATNKQLTEEVKKGNFRADLYYRLNVISIRLPTLRERREDIPLLVEYFLEQARKDFGRPGLHFVREAMQLLEDYHWPGNVRELRNVMERSVHMAWGDNITPECLPPELTEVLKVKDVGFTESGLSLEIVEELDSCPGLTMVERVERDMLLKTVKDNGGNMTRAAAQLQMARSTLYRKLKKHGCI